MGYEGLLPSSPLVVDEEDDESKCPPITTDGDGIEEEEFEFDFRQADDNDSNVDNDVNDEHCCAIHQESNNFSR